MYPRNSGILEFWIVIVIYVLTLNKARSGRSRQRSRVVAEVSIRRG